MSLESEIIALKDQASALVQEFNDKIQDINNKIEDLEQQTGDQPQHDSPQGQEALARLDRMAEATDMAFSREVGETSGSQIMANDMLVRGFDNIHLTGFGLDANTGKYTGPITILPGIAVKYIILCPNTSDEQTRFQLAGLLRFSDTTSTGSANISRRYIDINIFIRLTANSASPFISYLGFRGNIGDSNFKFVTLEYNNESYVAIEFNAPSLNRYGEFWGSYSANDGWSGNYSTDDIFMKLSEEDVSNVEDLDSGGFRNTVFFGRPGDSIGDNKSLHVDGDIDDTLEVFVDQDGVVKEVE